MALKPTSGSWNSAQDENRGQRDALREAFFAQAGVKVTASMRDVHLRPATRIRKLGEVMQVTLSPRIDDKHLAKITGIAQTHMVATGLCVPALGLMPESRSKSIKAFAPEVLRSFFTGEKDTTLDRSLF